MSAVEIIEVDARPGGCAPGAKSKTCLTHLKPYGQALLKLPGLRLLRPAARRAWAVSEPPGRVFMAPQPKHPGTGSCHGLTVLTANLWHDWPKHRQLLHRLEVFAGLVEESGVELVLLQEVSRTPDIWVDSWLAQRLGMAYVYSRANGHLGGIGFEEGLAIFSRYPLQSPRLQQLGGGMRAFSRRLALGASVATPCGEFFAASAHLGYCAVQIPTSWPACSVG